jgi:hypothetical protein
MTLEAYGLRPHFMNTIMTLCLSIFAIRNRKPADEPDSIRLLEAFPAYLPIRD